MSRPSKKMQAKLNSLLNDDNNIKRAIEKMKQAVDAGYPDNNQTKFTLAKHYLQGIENNILQPNPALSFKYFSEILASSDTSAGIRAQTNGYIGWCYKKGLGTTINLKKAFMHFQLAARAGDADAMKELSSFFEEGIAFKPDGTQIPKPDLGEAIKWLKIAAELKNHLPAQMALGKLYECKLNSPIQAETYYELAATNHHHPDAMFNCAKTYVLAPELFSKKIDKTFSLCLKMKKILSSKGNIHNYGSILLWIMGICYLKSYGIKQDIQQAFDHFKKAEAEGEEIASIWVAKCYLEAGPGWKKNQPEGIAILEALAEKSKTKMIQTLAIEELLRQCSQLLPNDFADNPDPINKELLDKYIALHQKAAELDHAGSITKLAQFYAEGILLSQDVKKAEELCRKVMVRNYPPAFVLFGTWQSRGIGVAKNPQLAFQSFKKASELGSPEADYELARCYFYGIGTEKNPKQAFEYFNRAKEKGPKESNVFLGKCYEFGLGVEENAKLAFESYQRGSELGDMAAWLKLGSCYLRGIGIKPDDKKAVACFQHAAKQKVSVGYYGLAVCYYFGYGVIKDCKKAMDLFMLVEEKDRYPSCLLFFARILEEGIPPDVPPNPERALVEYARAREMLEDKNILNNTDLLLSKTNLEFLKSICLVEMARLYLWGPDSTRDTMLGITYLEQAAVFSAEAQSLLGKCYLKGLGVARDQQKAFYYYNEAAKRGVPEAIDFFTLKKLNDEIFTQLLMLPHKFHLQKQSESCYLEVLMEQVKINQQRIDKYKEHISVEKLKKIQAHNQSISFLFDQTLAQSRLFDERYNAVYMVVKDVCDKNERRAEPDANELITYMSLYQHYYNLIVKENAALAQLQETLKAEHEAKDKAIVAPAQADPKEKERIELLEKLKKEQEKQEAIALTLKKDQAEHTRQEEERKTQREHWLQLKKARFEAKQKVLLEAKLLKEKEKKQEIERQPKKELGADLQVDIKTGKESHKAITLPNEVSQFFKNTKRVIKASLSSNQAFKKRKATTLADWQPAVLIRTKVERELLDRVYDYFSKTAAEGEKLTLEDAWIEREVLINLLGRLLEVVKQFNGQQNMPKQVARHLRNVLFKSDYFKISAETKQENKIDVLLSVLKLNQELREAVGKILNYLKLNYSKNPPKSWLELRPHIQSSLLDNLMAVKLENHMESRKLSFNDCKERVEAERIKLSTLNKYSGVFANKEIMAIARSCVEARWGSLSSYLVKHKKHLLPQPTQKAEELFNTLVRGKLIRTGNELRHSKKPLRFSKDKSVPILALATEATQSVTQDKDRDKDVKTSLGEKPNARYVNRVLCDSQTAAAMNAITPPSASTESGTGSRPYGLKPSS